MYNCITRKDHDPIEAFSNLWVNTETGSMWVWVGKPMLVVMPKDGKVLTVDTFDLEFVQTPQRNKQEYSHALDVSIPVLVLADIEGDGEKITIGDYGDVEADNGLYVVCQKGNFKIGSDFIVSCEPKKLVKIKLYIISYE